jgi:hypothetical protein
MKISDRTAGIIEKIGSVLLIGGFGVFAWALMRFPGLPNYLRIAALVPFAFSIPMITVESYRSGWASLSPREKGQSIAWLIVPVVLPLGSLAWYLIDPTATG